MLQNEVYDQGLHCAINPAVRHQQVVRRELFEFDDKYGKEIKCPYI